jgi:hypothetical protein
MAAFVHSAAAVDPAMIGTLVKETARVNRQSGQTLRGLLAAYLENPWVPQDVDASALAAMKRALESVDGA